MSKLSKPEIRDHERAMELVLKDEDLTHDEQLEVLAKYHPGANHMNSKAGAFFTPYDLAWELAFDIGFDKGHWSVDICAGIGVLARAWMDRTENQDNWPRKSDWKMVCIEKNPDYIRVGKKVVPEAIWIQGDVFDAKTWKGLPYFKVALMNPPFGKVPFSKEDPIPGLQMKGDFDLRCLELGLLKAEIVGIIAPSKTLGYVYSGRSTCYRKLDTGNMVKLEKVYPDVECFAASIDCDSFIDEWKGVKPRVEMGSVSLWGDWTFQADAKHIKIPVAPTAGEYEYTPNQGCKIDLWTFDVSKIQAPVPIVKTVKEPAPDQLTLF